MKIKNINYEGGPCLKNGEAVYGHAYMEGEDKCQRCGQSRVTQTVKLKVKNSITNK